MDRRLAGRGAALPVLTADRRKNWEQRRRFRLYISATIARAAAAAGRSGLRRRDLIRSGYQRADEMCSHDGRVLSVLYLTSHDRRRYTAADGVQHDATHTTVWFKPTE